MAQWNSSTSHKNQPSFTFYPGAGRGRDRGRGRGFPNNGRGYPNTSHQSSHFSNSTHPVWQVCFKVGHIAAKCYHRFDQSYQGDSIHPTAFLTTQHKPTDLNWYHDTGSTHHLTNDLSNLNIRADAYHGPDQI